MIPFNKPYLTGQEINKITEAYELGQMAGDGHFSSLCSNWLEKNTGAQRALLTHSCTAALEMAAILLDISPGDEIIMPSYTFVSSANAFVLRGGIPVFVDIREDTFNIDETLIEAAITPMTKAILPVHYAGVACEMDVIMGIAKKYNLFVVEDAAQGIMSQYKGQPLGSIGDLGCLSFHETKNIISGEGGALLINNISFIERAEIIRAKGTNRAQFFRGEVDKYSWQDIGSSFLPGETVAAFLFAQLQDADHITEKRLKIWNQFNEFFSGNQGINFFSIPVTPENCKGNGHIYYLVMDDKAAREHFINYMKKQNIHCIFHYIPLHNSDAGKKYGRISGAMKVTEDMASRIVRLPLWIGVSVEEITEAVSSWEKIYSQ
jgi:dTDP-4-amino-4,6-dideoxygalactose transaminase